MGAEFRSLVRAVAEGLLLRSAAGAEGIEFVLLQFDGDRRIARDVRFQCHGDVLEDLDGFYQSMLR